MRWPGGQLQGSGYAGPGPCGVGLFCLCEDDYGSWGRQGGQRSCSNSKALSLAGIRWGKAGPLEPVTAGDSGTRLCYLHPGTGSLPFSSRLSLPYVPLLPQYPGLDSLLCYLGKRWEGEKFKMHTLGYHHPTSLRIFLHELQKARPPEYIKFLPLFTSSWPHEALA